MSSYITAAAHNFPVARGLPYSTPPYAAMLRSFPEGFISSNRPLFNHARKNPSPARRAASSHSPILQTTLRSANLLPHTGIGRLWPTEVEELLEPRERNILQHNAVPDISKISTKKWNLFHSLGLSLQIPLMDELLEQGWDINSVDKDGYTALHMAVIGKKEAVISHLLRKGANPHIRDQEGATALHYAVQAGAMQTVKLLIKYKVDVNVADNDGWTPLHISMQSRSRDVAKVLLVNGADKTRRTKDGKTPLDLSMCYGRDFKSYDLAKLLKLDLANRSI